MAKKKNSRKVLAVALGIMGIAGLSLASASQLTINATGDNLATGLTSIKAVCDTDVNVVPVTTGTFALMQYTGLAVSAISTSCSNKTLSWSVTYTTDPGGVPDTKTGFVTLDNSGSASITLPSALLVSGYTLGDVALTIS